jgi:hypothetical protein
MQNQKLFSKKIAQIITNSYHSLETFKTTKITKKTLFFRK